MSIARVELSIVLLLLLPLSVVTCAEQAVVKPSNDAAAAPAKTIERDSPPSTGETCADVACQSNTDCCKGYACGFDPERSRIQRYCLGP